MAKGVIYVMTTVVGGLIKIGKCGTDKFEERMRKLESDGYRNVGGLKRELAVEVEDYDDKEVLIHEVFAKHRVAESELFALDCDLAKQLLLALDGKVIYPEDVDKEKEFNAVSNIRSSNRLFTFYKKGIRNGETIELKHDDSYKAVVCGERSVEYGGDVYFLSNLTKKLMEELGKVNKSGSYRGASEWRYNGTLLKDMPTVSDIDE